MKRKKIDLFTNVLVAVAISVVVNYSYLLLLFGNAGDGWRPRIPKPNIEYPGEGLLAVSPDGHGYLLYPDRMSVYVPSNRIRSFDLRTGDRLEIDVNPPRDDGAHPSLNRIYTLNDEPFDYSKFFDAPSQTFEMTLQFLFYFLCAYLLIHLQLRLRDRRFTTALIVRTVVLTLLVIVAMFLLAPVSDWRTGVIRANMMQQRNLFDAMLLLKCSFVMIVSLLYSWIRQLVWRQQGFEVEIEQLKNESLTARYDMLVGQISPHFFFNSLNSLSMLVREQRQEQALGYIEQLSYCFRYILQNSQNTLIPLSEEMKFAEAFTYQYSIRYADKLFFDFAIDERYLTWKLPVLSLQPLIGNAVKHNTITKSRPLHVSIRTTADDRLEISNPIVPKFESEPSTGIGLKNLENRWRLITGRPIEILNDGATFTVRLPLLTPDNA